MRRATVRATLMLRPLAVSVVLFSAASCEAGGKKLNADAAATLVAFRQQVQLKPVGAPARPAAANDQLKADDAIAVPGGGFALLQLVGNGHVVRIDEDLELKVKELALFGAPKTEVTLKAQLDQLLTPEERKGVNERMTGFYATAAAAETRAAERESATAKAESGPPARPNSVAPPSAPAPEPQPASVAESDQGPSAGAPPPRKKASLRGVNFGSANEYGGGAPTWPAPEREAALRTCLLSEVKKFNAQQRIGPKLTVRYRLIGGTLQLSLEGALPVPQCARDWFKDAPPPESPTWQSFELSL
jgi:hypothetical protein